VPVGFDAAVQVRPNRTPPSSWRIISRLDSRSVPRPGGESVLKAVNPASVGIDSFTNPMRFFV
jgi:hypothetical protein